MDANKIYVVAMTINRIYGQTQSTQVYGTFKTIKDARECLDEERNKLMDEWVANKEDWDVEDERDFFILASLDGEHRFMAQVMPMDVQETFTSYKDMMKDFTPSQRKAFNYLRTHFSPNDIIRGAMRGEEKPYGYLSDYVRNNCEGVDVYESAKVAEVYLKFLHIDNEDCPWLNDPTHKAYMRSFRY